MKVLSRSAVFAIIIALTLVSISVTSVFAAAPVIGSKISEPRSGIASKMEKRTHNPAKVQVPGWPNCKMGECMAEDKSFTSRKG